MLGTVLQKIESGDFDFNSREIKYALPYARKIIMQNPDSLRLFIDAIPEAQRVERMVGWFAQVIPKHPEDSHIGSVEAANFLIREFQSLGRGDALVDLLSGRQSMYAYFLFLQSSPEEGATLEKLLSASPRGEKLLHQIFNGRKNLKGLIHKQLDEEQVMYLAELAEKYDDKETYFAHAQKRGTETQRAFIALFDDANQAESLKAAKDLLAQLEDEPEGKEKLKSVFVHNWAQDALSNMFSMGHLEMAEWFLKEAATHAYGGDTQFLVRNFVTSRNTMNTLHYMFQGSEEARAGAEKRLDWLNHLLEVHSNSQQFEKATTSLFADLFHLSMSTDSARMVSRVLQSIEKIAGKDVVAKLVLQTDMRAAYSLGNAAGIFDKHQIHSHLMEWTGREVLEKPRGDTVGGKSGDSPNTAVNLHGIRHLITNVLHREEGKEIFSLLLKEMERHGGEGTAAKVLESSGMEIAGAISRFCPSANITGKLIHLLDCAEEYGGRELAVQTMEKMLESPDHRRNSARFYTGSDSYSLMLEMLLTMANESHTDAARGLVDKVEEMLGAGARKDLLDSIEGVRFDALTRSWSVRSYHGGNLQRQAMQLHSTKDDTSTARIFERYCELFGEEAMRKFFNAQRPELLAKVYMQAPERVTGFLQAAREFAGDKIINDSMLEIGRIMVSHKYNNPDAWPVSQFLIADDSTFSVIEMLKEIEGGKELLLEMLTPKRYARDGRIAYSPLSSALKRYDPATVDALLDLMLQVGGTEFTKDQIKDMVGDVGYQRYRISEKSSTALASALVGFGLEDMIPLIEDSLPQKTKDVLSDESLNKHERLQELGGGLARWKAVFNKPAPDAGLSLCSPFKFSGKVYDQMLPLMKRVDYLERSNSAKINAYKLAVMFSSAQEAERYLDRAQAEWHADSLQPVHDAMLFNIPKTGQWNPPKWKDLLLKYGPAVSKQLELAPRIEKVIAEENIDFPSTPAELQAIAARVVFERGRENPELAKVVMGAGVSEDNFNTALDIIAESTKTRDNLPDIFIDGADVGEPNFYMHKLPVGDPRGLFLGKLTNCCQSIGGAGAGCAIHGFTSEDGGFYVWKHKTKGRITDDDTIVAQSWVWRGEDNSLVFDSFERLGGAYNSLVKPFMEQFAHEARDHTFPDDPETGEPQKLQGVRLGCGGATPNQDFAQAKNPAHPRGHEGYRDSRKQYEIPARPFHKAAIANDNGVKEADWSAREEALRQETKPKRAIGL